jgi:lysophospholipase L1-like esterase
MLDQVADVHPDIVVVAGGLNDRRVFASNPADVAHAVMDTFHQLRDRLPQAQIVAIGPTFFADVTPELVAFDQFVEDAADSVGAEFVSLISPTPVLRAEMFLPDHLHVDEAGHSAIADRILSTLAIQEGAPHGT